MDSSCHPCARGRGRKRRVLGAGAVGVVAAVAALAVPAAGAASAVTTQSFTTPGQYSFMVPAGVSSISVAAVGGAGGACSGSAGGEGASVAGTFAVQPGERLSIGVAGPGGTCPGPGAGIAAGGVGGGGSGGASAFTGAGGGGDSEVGTGLLPSYPASADGLLIVGGGGGGAGSETQGGDAGAPGQADTETVGGAPGTATGGGAGGTDLSGTPGSTNGLPGTFGLGGAGGIAATGGGGGGGGGYYGGGGGSGSGGGGGSSFLTASATDTSGPTVTSEAASVDDQLPDARRASGDAGHAGVDVRAPPAARDGQRGADADRDEHGRGAARCHRDRPRRCRSRRLPRQPSLPAADRARVDVHGLGPLRAARQGHPDRVTERAQQRAGGRGSGHADRNRRPVRRQGGPAAREARAARWSFGGPLPAGLAKRPPMLRRADARRSTGNI